MNKKALIFSAIVIGLLMSVIGCGNSTEKPAADHTGENTASAHDAPASGSAIVTNGDTVTMNTRARQVSGVQTARAAVRNLTKDIRTTGKVTMNENGRRYITSRVEGRLEKLYVASEGEYIAPGQILADLYSPAYIAAQEEYLLALGNAETFRDSDPAIDGVNVNLIEAARRKLELLNVPERNIRELRQNGKSNDLMPLYAQFGGTVIERNVLPGGYIKPGDRLFSLTDLSSVWIHMDIYEKDLASVKTGQSAIITSQAYPGETFSGKVVFISPVLDDASRTVRVRVELNNREGKLKPNMFVNAAISVPLGSGLVIPESAILDSGEEQIVYVETEENTFVRRKVVAGQNARGYVRIRGGLEEGDIVVTAAAFLIDSQTKLGGFAGHGGHGGN
ncbi:MAG: efflux RND transporter periplasmic adaptor subunit [Spirochaetales bacterium]|jgi:Cu(I)/Ag(I) efflux system membrane fusion protein|nr:efflux RND transporter periplasmic adaptor subunit [Spirochaetales bacterium]